LTAAAWAAFAATVVVAIVDWIAVLASSRRLEYAAKPAVMVGLIAVAILLHPTTELERWFFVGALALGLVSDVFLMLPRDMFLAGLVAALVEHIAYTAGFRARTLDALLFGLALIVALVSVAVFLPTIHRALRRDHRTLVGPVLGYVAVFVVMVASAGGSGSRVALVGALLFFYSDALLAWNRFVHPVTWGRFANIVAYHSGQALLVLSLVY
jgi:uncharacterized membrane protein YhhN